ncbi:hypothetical protein FZI91_20505 [Mycobacterium sp. CBMA271]|uniref:hypothetical protein n=1 Tax=unclassified Mycobacteroides TaxID=2618759 RepID=UPI0012DF7302|nr:MULTISPECIES: hypothetical protein [unclassified Mycobacteroides]MUM16941.1 hypothetical protein [Mycobacteroides sp. CBMA 326]MUM24069.1 hypothetical protein [Mycobacteroides sp. CBMA 271]
MAIYNVILLVELGIGVLSIVTMLRLCTTRDTVLRRQARRLSLGGVALSMTFCLLAICLGMMFRWEATEVLWCLAVGSAVGITIATAVVAPDNTRRGRWLAAFWSGIGVGLICTLVIFVGLFMVALSTGSGFVP